MALGHEKLDVYRLAIGTGRTRSIPIPIAIAIWMGASLNHRREATENSASGGALHGKKEQ